MTRRIFYVLLSVGMIGLTLATCTKSVPDPVPTGQLALTFDNVVGTQDLTLGTGTYRNGSNESFTPTNFNYYISNLKLIRADGSQYVVPADSSYFLIRESVPASQRVLLNGVPSGDYKAVSFVIGVDSLRSTMDISQRTGVLDPGGDHASASGMYWSWNSGYIFMKLEGTSPSAPVDATGLHTFRYHIGFFGGRDTRTLNNLQTVSVSFNTDRATVGAGKLSTINLQTDVLKIFDGPTTISIAANPEVMVADYSRYVAANYAQMIQYRSITTAVR